MSDPMQVHIIQVSGRWRERDAKWRPALGTDKDSAFYNIEAAKIIVGGLELEANARCSDAKFRIFSVTELPGMVP